MLFVFTQGLVFENFDWIFVFLSFVRVVFLPLEKSCFFFGCFFFLGTISTVSEQKYQSHVIFCVFIIVIIFRLI